MNSIAEDFRNCANIGVLMKTLDVSRLPRQALYGSGVDEIDLATVVTRLRPAVYEMGRRNLIKPVKSFGFAAAHPLGNGVEERWKNPYDFIWFVAGWGPDQDRYIANAVRKLRAVLRTGKATLVLREEGSKAFKKKVDQRESDGSFKWGDFPWGGGVLTGVGGMIIPTAVSCLLEVEDHALALLGGGLVGGEMLQRHNPTEYGPNS